MKKSNPHLKELLMDVVDNQIRNDDPLKLDRLSTV
jgi:hypothetical protein